MSTKIYNGYKISAMTMRELQDRLELIRPKVLEARNELIRSFYTKDSYWENRLKLQERANKVKTTLYHDPLVDYSFEITFLTSPDSQDIFALVYCEHEPMRQVWIDDFNAQYYGYWNSSDPEEGISEADWKARGKEWDRALGMDSRPSGRGLTFTMVDYTLPLTLQVYPEKKEVADAKDN